MKNRNKRPFMLLEVMICFMLVAMCALPLIYPHIGMYKEQKEFIHKIELDHAVNLIYADIIEKMHKNEITLANVTSNQVFRMDPTDLKKYQIAGFTGTYQFKEKHKPPSDQGFTVYLIDLVMDFKAISGGKTQTYNYKIFAGAQGLTVNSNDSDGADDND